MLINRFITTLLGGAFLLLGGCASVTPYPVAQNNPSLSSVRENIPAFQQYPVTWGGEILSVAIKPHTSLITVLAKPLDSDGEPLRGDKSEGRFLVLFDGFKDPAVFARGRLLTVTGTVEGVRTQKIGQYDYHYPLIHALDSRLWPVPPRYRADDDFGGYFWYPWSPWYPAYPVYIQPNTGNTGNQAAPSKH